MSRYRPPQPRSKPYITLAGMNRLRDELDGLWKKRTEVTNALSAAAAEGDRSENAEYIYRKKQLAGIDRRIRYLQKRMPDLKVVETPGDARRIFFGARAELEDDRGDIVSYCIVGADEISSDSSKGYISVDSPMAKAMLGKAVDDEFELKVGDNLSSFVVVSINYAELLEYEG